MTDLATALEFSLADNPAIEAKFEALKNLQALKTKSLMTSIDALNKEVTRLKVLTKDGRRAQMVQALRNKMRDYDLIVDVLKEELVKNSDMDREEINDIIIRKTTGGPKRFRPATREELERKIVDYEKQIKKMEKYKLRNGNNQNEIPTSNNINNSNNNNTNNNKTSSDKQLSRHHSSQLSLKLGNDTEIGDSAKFAIFNEEIKQLKSSVDLKEGTIQSLKEEVSRLRASNAELSSKSEGISLKEKKIDDLNDAYNDIKKKLEVCTLELAESKEECNIIQEAADADAEMLRKELEQLYSQCENLLRQNTVLLKQMGERELDDINGSGSDGDGNSIRQLKEKLERIQLSLRQSESTIKQLEAYKDKTDVLRDELREKNEIIRELKRNTQEISRIKS